MHTLLEYQRKTHFPTAVGNLRLRVDADGSVYFQRNDEEPPRGAQWTHDYGPEPTARIDDAAAHIAALLRQHGFFEMEPLYRNPLSVDGMIETLRYDDGQSTHTVTVDRARVEPFRKLVNQLMSKLGIRP